MADAAETQLRMEPQIDHQVESAAAEVSDAAGDAAPGGRGRRVLIVVGLAAALGVTVALLGLLMARGAPGWWRPVRAGDPAAARQAERLENAVWSQISLIRPTDAALTTDEAWVSVPWSVSLSAQDATAWLNERLPMWLAHKESLAWPKEIAEVQIDFAEGKAMVGMRIVTGQHDQVVAAVLRPELKGNGELWSTADRISLGRLPLPANWALESVRTEAAKRVPEAIMELPETKLIFDAFRGERPLVENAVVRLEDGRRVRLLKIVMRDGRLEITCRTERR